MVDGRRDFVLTEGTNILLDDMVPCCAARRRQPLWLGRHAGDLHLLREVCRETSMDKLFAAGRTRLPPEFGGVEDLTGRAENRLCH